MSFKNLRLSVKIPMVMIVLACLNAGIVGGFAVHEAKQSSLEQAEEKIAAIGYGVELSLQNYFKGISDDLVVHANSDTTRLALSEFQVGWDALNGINQTQYLQAKYITDNPNELGKKHLMDFAKDGSVYSEKHAKFHLWFRNILNQHEYYDIFLVNPQGDVVFTVYKELDFATNLLTGQWKDTGLANLFRAIKEKPEQDKVVFEDFAAYSPSNNIPAAFIGAPIMGDNGEFLGAMIYQMPIGRINVMTQIAEDISKTAEVHLIGEDFLLRNDPDTSDKEDPMLKEKFEIDAVKSALAGKKGTEWGVDDGHVVLDSYAPFDAFGKKWVVLVDVFQSEALESVEHIQKIIWGATFAILALVALISVLYARSITNPIKSLMTTMGSLANKDYSVAVPFGQRGDELGDMSRAVEVFKQNGLVVQKLEAEQEAQEIRAEQEKKEAMHKLANDFDSRTSGIIKSLAAAATEMQATAAQMTAASSNTAHASQIVASAAAEADSNVQTVEAATEELSASSLEISRQISSVAEKSNRASGEAVRTNEQVGELNTLADSIGDVIGAIKAIAEQTNLLALNATIEAARAGEAGKGFAVVADEVKKLATETANKTVEIDERVGRIQSAIRGTVDAVGRIIADVQDIDHSTATVASAVEEQNAATSEIGRNVSEASTGTQEVARNIVDVQRNAEETGDAATNLSGAANELAEIAENLQTQVRNFLREIRGS